MSRFRRLLNTFRSDRVQRDIDREVSFHIAERADELRGKGLGEDEAMRRARSQFGNPLLQAERTRDIDIAGWLDTTLRNVRYATRTLARTPVFTITVILTLALGIGANSAVFSALDAVLLRPLPFRSSIWLLFGAVSVLLLITSMNIAALLLSRAAHRRQEISIRLSLGASRAAVGGQMLTEAGVLALAALAALVPAMRAAFVEPMQVLRED